MAELKLTPEEIATHNWLDLDDEALGRAVKRRALVAHETLERHLKWRREEKGEDMLWLSGVALLLGTVMDEQNVGVLEQRLERTRNGKDNGVVNITVKIDPPTTGTEG